MAVIAIAAIIKIVNMKMVFTCANAVCYLTSDSLKKFGRVAMVTD